MTERRRTFGPVVLLGLAAGTLTAVAGNKPWAAAPEGSTPAGSSADLTGLGGAVDVGKMPVAAALALVVLACWGVVLVTRRRVRRAVAVLGALAALGTAASVVVGWSATSSSVVDDLADQGVVGVAAHHTGWFWAAAVGALVSVVATVLAIRLTPHWPEMGSRYDAPGADGPPPPVPVEDQTSIDLWKAMDEGRDPTA